MKTLQHKRGTAAILTANNPVIPAGEFCIETDTGRVKIGNGSTAWNSLAYLAPAASDIMLNANLRWAMQTTATAIDWLPRGHGTIGNTSATSGNLMLAFFTAPYSITATTLTFVNAGTATASLSLCRFALFTVSETITDSVTVTTPSITMVARSASDTTIGNVANTIYTRTFATAGGYPSSYNIVGGNRYAVGLLIVGSTPGAWQAATVTSGSFMRLPPMATGAVTGLSDIPTSATSVSLGNFTLYGRLA